MTVVINGSTGLSGPNASGDTLVNGVTVGRGAGAVATNTAVGASALAVNTSGSQNTSAGALSLVTNITGTNNSAFGYGALYSSTASNNTGIGNAALTFNSSGSANTAVGAGALLSNTTASNNTAVGYQAGLSNTTGRRNTFIGTEAGYSVTTGVGNAFIGTSDILGRGAGYYVTTGSGNTIMGGYDGNLNGLDIRTASNYIVLSDGSGNIRAAYNATGVQFTTQATPVSKAATVTLTGAEVLTGIVLASGTGFTLTLPTGTALDTATGGMAVNTAFDFTLIKTDSSSVTLAVNTGITTPSASQSLIISAVSSATYRLRKTAANTFVMYRVT